MRQGVPACMVADQSLGRCNRLLNIQPRTVFVVMKLPEAIKPVLANARKTTARVAARLSRQGVALRPWHIEMTRATLFALALIVVAFPGDGVLLGWVRASDFWFLRFLAVITDAAKSHFYLIIAGVLVIAIGSLDWRGLPFGKRRQLLSIYSRCAFIFTAIAVPGIGINIIKQIVGRVRPKGLLEFGPHYFDAFEFQHLFQSFPSGHATTAGSLGMLVALFYPPARTLAFIMFGLLAFSRVAAGAHYLSDVIAGYTIGALFTLWLARWLAQRRVVFGLQTGTIFPNLIV